MYARKGRLALSFTYNPRVLTGSMLALGFLHGFGADHLMAIAALSLATPLGPARYARAFGLAVRFAIGHAVLLAVGAGLVLFFGWQIPVRVERGGEFLGGCLLIALGLVVGWLTLTRRLYVHSHVHDAGEHGVHRHWHLHFTWWGRHSHRPSVHTVLPGVLGAVFAISGLRALVLSLPLWSTAGSGHHFGSLLFLVAIFALGILLSMSLFGILLAHMLADKRMTGHVARFSAAATAVGSLALGIYWITAL
jgi:nickel/cobalt transporter (NicO) family protein